MFCKSLVAIPHLRLSADKYKEISEGDIMILQYSAVREHVLGGEVILL